MRDISIRAKVTSIVLVFLAFFCTAFYAYLQFTTANYKRLRVESIERIVAYETEKVNKKIAQIERGAIHFAISGLLCLESGSISVGETSVIEYLRDYPDAEGGGFWFEPYAYNEQIFRFGVYAHFDDAKAIYVLDETMYDDGVLDIGYYDYHAMSWYREIFDTVTSPSNVSWTKPYVDDSGSFSLMTTAGAGIFDGEGRLVGTSNIDWKIEDVVKALTVLSPTENSFVLLCVPEKNYIISNTYSQNGEQAYSAGADLDSLGWDIGAESFEYASVRYMAFQQVLGNNWFLSVCIPENEIFAEVENQNERFSLIVALCAAALLSAAFFMTSQLVNKPLKHLIREVSGIGLGNLDVNIDLKTNDELGVLAGTFNKMTADLKASIEENARVLREKERIGAELDVATKIQASMLPCIFPPFPDRKEFEIYASMLPAEEVGGDFYDFFLVDSDTIALVIADVSDKGVPAALFMVIAKTLIKNNAQAGKSPKDVFETVNNMLCENNEAGMFVTAFLGYLDIPTGRLTFVNAGHNPPLLCKDGKVDWLRSKPNIMLAALGDMEYEQHTVTLNPGDELFLYTDGITEAMNLEHELYGESRLLESVKNNRDLPLMDFTVSIQDDIDGFTMEAQQSDDITMLALRFNMRTVGFSELTTEAKVENLDGVLEFVYEKLEGIPMDTVNQIGLAVDEVFTNIAQYAYFPSFGSVTVRVGVLDGVHIEFEDSGKAFNPLSENDPDLSRPIKNRELGGLGIFMVKKIMDSVEYKRDGKKNVLTIKMQL